MAEPAIRPMAAADIEAVAALARRVWNVCYPAIIPPAQIDYMLDQRYDTARLAAELAVPAIAWSLAETGGALAGFASTIDRRPDGIAELKLDKLYVDPDRQRSGIGGALIEDALRRARALGLPSVVLAVNKRNAQAIAAYRKHGFAVREAVCVDIGGGFVMDDFIMARSL
jgi:ribosomal protein S18 acetylase RimI-like enzyme